MAFDIKFWNVSDDPRTMYKRITSSSASTYTGTLRDESSIINPIVEIFYEQSSFYYNYAYIEAFRNRYYFIKDIVFVRTGLVRLYLKCDVLSTYRTVLKAQRGYIARSSNTYNPYIIDKRLPLNYNRTVTNESYLDTPFNVTDGTNAFNLYAVVCDPSGLNAIAGDGGGNNFAPIPSANFSPWHNSSVSVYELSTLEQMSELYYYFLSDTTKADQIISLYRAPFSSKVTESYDTVYTLSIGSYSHSFDTPLKKLTFSGTTNYTYSIDLTIPTELTDLLNTTTAWLAFEPYSSMRLYIPYYGWVDIPVNKCIAYGSFLDITVKFVFDMVYGTCTFIITAGTTLIATDDFDFNVDFPLTYTNAADVKRQRIVNYINFAKNMLSNVAGYASGIAGGYSDGISTRSLVSGGSSYTTGVLNSGLSLAGSEIMNVETGGVSRMGDSFNKLFTPQIMTLQLSKVKPAFDLLNTDGSYTTEYSNYIDVNGLPLMKSCLLNGLTGYVEVADMHLDIADATADELNELESIIKSGFFITS